MKKILISIVVLASLTACQKDVQIHTTPFGDVISLQAKDIHDTRAVIQGQINISPDQVAAYGFIFSESPITEGTEDSFDRIRANNVDQEAIFSSQMENLTNVTDGQVKGKIYYYKAYLIHVSGQVVYGDQIWFQTVPVTISDPVGPAGDTIFIGSRSVKMRLQVISLGSVNKPSSYAPTIELRPAEVGYYIWRVEENGEWTGPLQRVSPLAERETNIFGNYAVEVEIKELTPETKYALIPFVVAGAYYKITATTDDSFMTSYSNEGLGDVIEITTLPILMPEVETMGESEITPTSVLMEGKLIYDGDDEFCQFGFKIGTSSDISAMEGPFWADHRDSDGTYVVLKRELSPQTGYYYVAVAKNLKDTAYGTVESFMTLPVSEPIIGDAAPMEYAYRIDNTTPKTATIRAFILSDGGENLSEYGVMFGESPEGLAQRGYTTAINATTGLFYVDVSGLSGGKDYYYKIYARNSKGRVEGSQILSFRTPLDNQPFYYYPGTPSSASAWLRTMPYPDRSLTYYEADPFTGASGTEYYFFDRNLGATEPFNESSYSLPLSTTTITGQLKYIGYYYQHGFATPSATPDMSQTGNLASYGWTNTPSEAVPGTESPQWPDNPCPDGYDLPTIAQMNDITAAFTEVTLRTFFSAIRLGVSGEKAPGNGNITAAGLLLSEGNFWLKDASYNNNKAGNASIFSVSFIGKAIYENIPRFRGESVRCVRVIEP